MKDKKDLLKEWYDTGEVGSGEQVVVSRMPDSFQKMRTPEAPELETGIEAGIEVEPKLEPEEKTLEEKALMDVFVKTGVFHDALCSYREALKRGDEAMQVEFIKERIKNLSVEIMRLVDGI